MKLSVVIVNYNVSCFLEQALNSVYKALRNVEGEVFVVDNNSADNSLEMLAAKFPQVQVIANKENVGFARANNQAIRLSRGEYVLLLNPDTVVEEDTFEKCIRFMDETPDAGGLGVKMLNGKGEFLPESKRGIPLPSVAFYKLFGLSKLFPRSRKFGAYHLSYLSDDEIHSVEVLAGAFMMMRRSVLDQVGLLDEDYFMYGEDIDLSYRILKGGYKNYYFPETRIIHYKGESTKTGSLNYVHVFYKAMQIFARKHFSQQNARFFNFFINCAIWFRASLAALKRIAAKLLLPLIDFLLVYAGMFVLARYWSSNVLAQRHTVYPDFYYYGIIPLYIIVWLSAIALCNGYRKPIRLTSVNKGIAFGTIAILLVYALLPETLRFSRAVVVFGAMWTVIVVDLVRYFIQKLHIKGYSFDTNSSRRIAVVGGADESARVMSLVQEMEPKCEFAGVVALDEDTAGNGSVSCLKSATSCRCIASTRLSFAPRICPTAKSLIGWTASGPSRWSTALHPKTPPPSSAATPSSLPAAAIFGRCTPYRSLPTAGPSVPLISSRHWRCCSFCRWIFGLCTTRAVLYAISSPCWRAAKAGWDALSLPMLKSQA